MLTIISRSSKATHTA